MEQRPDCLTKAGYGKSFATPGLQIPETIFEHFSNGFIFNSLEAPWNGLLIADSGLEDMYDRWLLCECPESIASSPRDSGSGDLEIRGSMTLGSGTRV